MSLRRFAIPLLAAGAAIPAVASAAEVQLQATNPVIELSVTERVDSAPDTATIGSGVTTKGATAREALAANSAQMEKLVARIKRAGIDARDIQTTGISINPDYDYQPNQPPRLTGYNATNQVQVRVRDISDLGALIDAMVEAGANNLYGPNFSLDDDSTAKQAAREAAMKRAADQAAFYARQAGYTGVRLLSVSEAVSGISPYPVADGRMMRLEAAQAAAPVEPGQVGTSVTINVQYEMTR